MVSRHPEVLDVFQSPKFSSKWLSIEDLVQLTGLSDKSVRERVRELEITDVLEIATGSSGTRLFRLKEQYWRHLESEPTIPGSGQTIVNLRDHKIPPIARPIEIRPEITKEEWPFPFVAIMRDLTKHRDAIRKIILDIDRSELEQVFQALAKQRKQDKKSNPFEAVTVIALDGLVEGETQERRFEGFLVGTASTSQDSILGLHFGHVHVPMKIPIITASGLIQMFAKDRVVEKRAVNLPERLRPTDVAKGEFKRDLPGLPKILRQTTHYDLDQQLIAEVVEYLRSSRHYEADKKTIETVTRMRSNRDPVILLRRGSLTPGEQHPYDFLDPEKALFVGKAFDDYLRIKDRLHDNEFNGFGVIVGGEPRRAIFREIIDEMLRNKLPGWEKGRMNTLSDNEVLGLLLEEGEYTAILKKTPMEDVLLRMNKDRLRQNLGGAVYAQYEERRQKMKTYQCYLGTGVHVAVRYDYPVYRDSPEEATSVRESCLPYLIPKSSPEDEFGPTIPRILIFALDLARDRAAEIDKLLPSWFGGKKL